jgi:acyl carrier protein
MIPSAFVFLPALPRTPGGKVDRRALPAPSGDRPRLSNPYVAPSTALETQLVRIWEEALSVAPVGVDDDFLELGGDSLTASRVVAGVLRELQVTLSAARLFDCPNVGAMAAAIAEERSMSAGERKLLRPKTRATRS